MGRADELRAQLAAVEVEEKAVAQLRAAREVYRAAPDDAEARERSKAAAMALRAARAHARLDRDLAEAQEALQAAEEHVADHPTDTEAHVALAQARGVVERLTRLDAMVQPAPVAGGASVGEV